MVANAEKGLGSGCRRFGRLGMGRRREGGRVGFGEGCDCGDGGGEARWRVERIGAGGGSLWLVGAGLVGCCVDRGGSTLLWLACAGTVHGNVQCISRSGQGVKRLDGLLLIRV